MFEVCVVNQRLSLDPSRIPDTLAFLREHVGRWGFLIDQNEAGAFAARATAPERDDLRRIVARFKEPAVDEAMSAWHQSPETSDERWWVERMLSVADGMGLRS